MLKNPLSFVKPLVINLYYKKDVPAVGTYDPKYKSDLEEVAKEKNKNNYKSVFNSNTKRKVEDLIEKDKKLINMTHDYDVEKSF